MTLGALGGVKPLTRDELLALPPVINLPTLARALGVGEFVIRERARHDELGALGIRCLRVGVQYRVPTSDVLRALGIENSRTAGPDPPDPAVTPALRRRTPDEEGGRGNPTASQRH